MERKKRYRLNIKVFITRLTLFCCFIGLIVLGLILLTDEAEIPKAVYAMGMDNPPIVEVDTAPKQAAKPKAEDTLVLINWNHPVDKNRPNGLIIQGDVFGSEVALQNPRGSINEEAATAAKELFLSAGSEGIGRYILVSAYRSQEYQDKLFNERKKEDPNYGKDPFENPVKVVPGANSEHRTGLALDILCESYNNADDGFAKTPEGKWLAENAHKFGFILRYPKEKEHITGVIFEPWHYRYVGLNAARVIFEQGLCLEEYVGN